MFDNYLWVDIVIQLHKINYNKGRCLCVNIHESIDFVKSITMESSLSVMDTMINLIDKNNVITEYTENDDITDIIMESMMIFMESKNRDRDKTPRNEISKWMEKKGYWYTGDNPKKKKECMRMYHFLQQHKFDPKDETYESDIESDNGKRKRIKLAIDYDDSDPDSNPNKNIRNSELKDNAWYSRATKSISIGSPMMKNKQQLSQFILKHEEGHANDHDKQQSEDKNIKNIKNAANQFLNDTKKTGQFVNSHDTDSAELYADLYGAKHSKIRTKGAGEKHGQTTRNFKRKDVEKAFNKLSHMLNESTDYLSNCKRFYDNLIDNLEGLGHLEMNKYSNFRNFDIGSPSAMIKFRGIFISNNESDEFISFIDDISELIDDIKMNKYKVSKAKDELIKLKTDEKDISAKQKEIDELIEIQSELIEELQSNRKSLIKFKDRTGFNISHSTVLNIERIITKYRGTKMKDIPEQDKKIVQDFLDNTIMPKINKRLDEIEFETKSAKKLKETIGKGMEHSTKMRHDFVKKFIKEYFEALYDDYYMINE